MSIEVPLKIFRYRPGSEPHYEQYKVTVPDDANVIDAIMAVWSDHDRNLMFRHACHHASCGTCAVRLNGYECLPCIVSVKEALARSPELLIEPLRNFPLVGDLVVDVAGFFQKLTESGMRITRTAEPTLDGRPYEPTQVFDAAGELADCPYNRFENCIECGICISACPTLAAGDTFLGPAAIASLERALCAAGSPQARSELLALADGDQGVWRCHSAFECTEACPQNVEPGAAAMRLRRTLVGHKVKALFGRDE